MRRLRPLSEVECYARCYGGWERTVRVVPADHPPRRAFGRALEREAPLRPAGPRRESQRREDAPEAA